VGGLPDGPHTFFVKVRDEAGNEDASPAQRSFTVDTSAPSTQITGGPSGPTGDDTPTFTWTGSDSLSASTRLRFSFRVDDGPWSPFSGDTSATLGDTTGLADGPHTFFVRARDEAGNVESSPAESSFTVDTSAPAAPVIDSPRENDSVMSSFVVTGTAEAGSTIKLFEGLDVRGTATADTAGNWSVSLSRVSKGGHTYAARATDAVGNTSEISNPRTVIVDTTGPRVETAVPGKDAIGVDPAANVKVFFSEAMQASTVNGSTFKLFKEGSTTPIAAAVDYDAAAEMATLDPSDPLVEGKRYKAVVTTGAKDAAGNRLDQDPRRNGLQPKVWFFRVGSR
jgi:hypothetical protein